MTEPDERPRTDLEEAYAILAGTTRLLPERRHLEALVAEHERRETAQYVGLIGIDGEFP